MEAIGVKNTDWFLVLRPLIIILRGSFSTEVSSLLSISYYLAVNTSILVCSSNGCKLRWANQLLIFWRISGFSIFWCYAYLSLDSIKLRCPMSNVFGKKWPTHVFFHTSLEYFLLFMWWFRVRESSHKSIHNLLIEYYSRFPPCIFLWVSSSNHRLNSSVRGCEFVSNFELNSTWIVK